jgi:hypothetical protein
MKKPLLIALLLILPVTLIARPDHPLESRIVTVRVTFQAWNEYRPWQKSTPQTRSFPGTVLPGNRILVLARHLENANLIQVERFDRPPRFRARIVHCDPQIGLALITVDDPEFFEPLNPVELAEHAGNADQIFYCAIWNSGQLSLASCRWSRVTVFNSGIPYCAYAGIYFITDLKSGGRGEPLFSEEKMVGITKSQSDDRITVIPSELINAYLQAVERPLYPGFAQLGLTWQYNRGKAQARYYGLEGTPRGIRICATLPGGSAHGILLPDDILLALDGHQIDSLGDYFHPRYGMIDYKYIATEGHFAGDTIQALVLRNKEQITLDIPLKNIPPSAARIPKARIDDPPPYLIAGGLVFRELDVPYLKEWGDEWEDRIPPYLKILYALRQEPESDTDQKLIVLADVFPDEYNLGYHDMAQNIVKTVNGQPIGSIAALEKAFQQPQGTFHVIELERSYGTSTIILDAQHFDEATRRIMQTYQIPERIRTRQTTTP